MIMEIGGDGCETDLRRGKNRIFNGINKEMVV